MTNTQFKIDLLEEQNSKFQTKNTELRNENTKLRNKNTKLRQDIEGHETRITKLEQRKKRITNVLQSSVNSNDTLEQIVSRCVDIPVSDNTSNSNHSVTTFDDDASASDISNNTSNFNSTHEHQETFRGFPDEQIVIQNENALTSDNVLNSDIYQLICTESKLSEDMEIDDFLDSTYKKKVKGLIQEITYDQAQNIVFSGINPFSNNAKIDFTEINSAQSLLDLFDKVKNLTRESKTKDKTARSQIYKEIKPFLPTITDTNLHKKTQRTRKIPIRDRAIFYYDIPITDRKIWFLATR
ncbi:hypothetical protein Glove_627g57 [Diversispora epigaea]|uniref:Uncharacterized protein n=1 Tax=Diversispora epigaea TaxID=1348612 RepID=A0A397G8Q3_9GLOM|nr:hypothetical protein Glove_627g57 [Diversispora epigaea]